MMDLEQQSQPTPDTSAPAAAPEAAPAPAPESQGVDLDKLISQTLDKMEGTEGAPTETDDDGPVRDPATGRFLPKAKAPDGTSEAPADSAPSIDKETPTNAAPAPKWTDGHFRGWSQTERDAFAKLTPEAQDLLMAKVQGTESHYKAKDTEFGQFKKVAEPLVNVIQEQRQYFDGLGMPPEQVVSALVRTEQTLRYGTYDQKVRLLSKMAEDYGIPIAVQQPDPYAEQPDQPGGPVYPVIHDLRSKVSQLETQLQAYQSSAKAEADARAATVFQEFASAKNADGSPRHPFLEQVKPAMATLLSTGQAKSLADAYELAAKPILDAIAQRVKVSEEAKAKAQADAIAKAKKAAPVRTSGIAPGGQTAALSLDAIISGALDQSGLH